MLLDIRHDVLTIFVIKLKSKFLVVDIGHGCYFTKKRHIEKKVRNQMIETVL